MSKDFHPAVSSASESHGHPHDLLARLYREIGISAVAAALEVYQTETVDDAKEDATSWAPLGEDLAA
jgi:hypothetical protein